MLLCCVQKGDLKLTKERKVLRSVSFTTQQLDKLEQLQEKEGISFAEHVRIAVNAYLNKKLTEYSK